MTLHRWAAKTDTAQAQIVRGLEKLGVQVWVIKQPCDLLCRYYDNALHRWLWQPLEVKTPVGTRNPKARRRRSQVAQNAFLDSSGTPVVTSLREAAAALGFDIPSLTTSASCTSPPISPPTCSVGAR